MMISGLKVKTCWKGEPFEKHRFISFLIIEKEGWKQIIKNTSVVISWETDNRKVVLDSVSSQISVMLIRTHLTFANLYFFVRGQFHFNSTSVSKTVSLLLNAQSASSLLRLFVVAPVWGLICHCKIVFVNSLYFRCKCIRANIFM